MEVPIYFIVGILILYSKNIRTRSVITERLIAPPRTGSSNSTETPVPQTYFTVRRPYVVRALHWLKTTTRYIGISKHIMCQMISNSYK